MSAAATRIIVEQPKPLELVPTPAGARINTDEHPLLPVFIIGAIALAGAFACIGTIVALLQLRYSGVLAP
jgi:hypothetical protein